MKQILVLGVTRLSDSYPNVRYKLALLAKIFGDQCIDAVIPVGGDTDFAAIMPGRQSGGAGFIWKLTIGHLKTFYRSAAHRCDAVYVCYPGILIAAWLGLPLVRSRYKLVYLDAFISLYDTVVLDRCLLKPEGFPAKLLLAMERRALNVATTVIVDTPENAAYYRELFDLPLKKFRVVPLSIPPMSPEDVKIRQRPESRLRCVFVGTFVPLQGVPVIVEAIKLLAGDPDIEFVFVGDGQDAKPLEEYVNSSPSENLSWHRGHFPTDFIVGQIRNADLCLGIFGEGAKTQRVLPYKLYYYMALAMPVITASSVTVERMLAECAAKDQPEPLQTVPPGDARALAGALRQLRDNRSELLSLGKAAGQYYQQALSEPVIQQQLTEIFRETESSSL